MAGLALVVVGVIAYVGYSPSPHGYLELLIAVPVMALGFLYMGAGLASAWRSIGWALRLVSVLLILVGLGPLGLVALIVLLGKVTG